MDYEVEFLPVGNGEKSGDAIVLRYGKQNDYKIMVVDGGTKESGQALVDHIKKYYETNYVDYVVNTHPDQDHASGLSIVMDQLNIGSLWIHRPWNYTSEIIKYFKDQRMTEESLKRRLKEKFSSAYNLEKIAVEKNISIYEPYQGKSIGTFKVLSPNKRWYLHELIPKFNKTPEQKPMSEIAMESIKTFGKKIIESFDIETLGEDAETSADNESSVILFSELGNFGVLLTGDAGVKALNKAYDYHPNLSSKLEFIQIPHHGSRRNVSPSILNKILGDKNQKENKIAFVSASKEAKKHPRQPVINAFIRRGCTVVSTEGNTIRSMKNMNNREGWGVANPLKFKTEFNEDD